MLSGTPLYWNPSGGSGTWNTNPGNTPWHTASPVGPAVAWDNSGDYQAVFPAGGASTITIGTGVTAGSISFADDGYVLTGATLTLAGDTSQIDVPGGDTATIDAPIDGAAGLVKTDGGILILSESNTYVGGTSITGGILQLAGSGTLGAGNNGLELDNGGILDAEGSWQTAGSISGNGGTIVSTTSPGGDPPLTYMTVANGDVSGNVELGAGMHLYLTGEIDGSLQLDSGAALQVDTGTLANNGTITWNGAHSIVLSNGGSIINDNMMSGYDGQVDADDGCSIINNSQIIVTGGTIDNSFFAPLTNNGTITLDGDVDLSNRILTGTYNLDPADGPTSCSGTLTLDDAVLNVQSELDLTGGEIELNSGSTLNVQGTVALSGGTLTVNDGSTLDVQGTLAVSGGTLGINDSTFIVEPSGQFNIDVLSDFTTTTDSVEGIYGTVFIDGNPIYDPAFGAPTVTEGTPYTLYLGPYNPETGGSDASLVTGSAPLNWSINWGDGSPTETFTDSDAYSYVAATHTFPLGVDTPTLHISATMPGFDNVASMVVYLPATTIGVTPPVPTGLTATESAAGEVDLSWSYNVNIASDFIVTVTDPGIFATSYEVDSSTLDYAFTGLPPDDNCTFSVAADAQLYDGTIGQSAPANLTAAASGTNLTATGSTSINENGTGTLTLNSGDSSSTITSWTVNWTDINGISLSTDTVTGAGGTDAYPMPSSTGLIANITAYDSAGSSFTLPAYDIKVLPIAPTTVSATAVSPNEIDLSWTNHSSLASEEEIMVSTDGTHFSSFDTINASNTTYQANGLIPDTSYTFKIVAIDSSNDESATASTAASATTQVDPWHASITGSSTVAEGGTYSLVLAIDPSLSAPAFNHWSIDWGDGTTTTNSSADITLTHGYSSTVSYSTIRVIAHTASGASSPLAVTMQPLAVDVIPAAPTALSAVMFSSTEVDLRWTNNSSIASGFNILRSLNGGPFTQIASIGGGSTTYDDSSLAPLDTVKYEVSAAAAVNPDSSTATTSSNVTTPTGLPVFTAVLGTAGSQSIVLTWGYQGSDDSGFEIEEFDPTVDDNFHTILTPGAVNSIGTATETVTGLTGGDTYSFRIRADRTDGSVSGYADGEAATIPIAAAPSLSVESVTVTGEYGSVKEIRVGWSGVLSGDGVDIQEKATAIPGGAWSTVWYGDGGSGAWPGTLQGSDSDPNPDPDPSADSQGFAINPGTFGGGSYTYRIASDDSYGNMTAWSEPQSASLDGGTGPAPQLHVDGTTITATWAATDRPASVLVEPDGTAPLIGNGASLPSVNYPAVSEDGSTYTSVMSNLRPGTKYDFVLWTSAGTGDEPVNEFGEADATTAGTPPATAPGAPSSATATLDPAGGNKVNLHWVNSPNNEAGYKILRSVGGGAFLEIGTTGADTTTYVDTLSGTISPGQSVVYEIESLGANDGPASGPATTQVLYS